MRILYFANPQMVHDCKWVQWFVQHHEVLVVFNPIDQTKNGLGPGIRFEPLLPEGGYPLMNVLKRHAAVSQLKALVKDFKPDIVHSMYAVPNALWAWQLQHPRHIITTRGSDLLVDYRKTWHNPQGLKLRLSYAWLRGQFVQAFAQAYAVTCTSTGQLEVANSLLPKHKPASIVRTGVDVQPYRQAFEAYSRPQGRENRFVVLSARNMRPLYQHELIIQAFGILQEEIPRLELWLIDTDPGTTYTQSIRAQIESLGLQDRVHWVPRQDATGMRQLYLDADAVAMMPASDGTPVSAVEAMLMERPLLMPPLPYDTDLFRPEQLFFAPAYTAQAVADTLRHLYHCPTPELRLRLKNAAELATTLANRATEMAKIEALYQQAVHDRP